MRGPALYARALPEQDMNKYEQIYSDAVKKNPNASWMKTAIAALAADIQEYTGDPVEVLGPFGLRSEVLIKTSSHLLVITVWFRDGNLILYYDTGKKNGEYYPEGSIGYLNNMDNETAPLPDTVEEIVSVMADCLSNSGWAPDS